MIPGLSIPRLVIGSAILVGGAAGAAALLSSDLPPATPLEELPDLVHARACERIAAELPEPGVDGRLLLPPLPGDRADALRTRLARAIDRTGRYEVFLAERPSPEGWFEAEVLPRLAEWLAELPGVPGGEDRPTRLLDARVAERQDDGEAIAIAVSWRLRDLASEGRPIAAGSAESRIERSLADADYLRWRIGEVPAAGRGLAWAAVLVVPWLLARRIAVEILRKESNGWNAALWTAAAAPGVIAAYVLTAFAAGWGGAALAAVAALAAAVLAYAWLNRLELARR